MLIVPKFKISVLIILSSLCLSANASSEEWVYPYDASQMWTPYYGGGFVYLHKYKGVVKINVATTSSGPAKGMQIVADSISGKVITSKDYPDTVVNTKTRSFDVYQYGGFTVYQSNDVQLIYLES